MDSLTVLRNIAAHLDVISFSLFGIMIILACMLFFKDMGRKN